MADLPPGFRLLVAVTGLGLGGTERHLAAVLPALAARGAAVRVLALRPGGEMADALRACGVRVTHAPASLGPPGGFLALLRELLAWRPDAVHLFLPEAYVLGGLAACAARARPVVMSRRSLNAYQAAHPRAARLERWLHRRMDALIGNSRAVCAELRAEGAPAARIGLLRNGVVTAAPLRDRNEVRTALRIPPEALAILCVANLVPYKGHADLMEAFARARAALPEAVLVLAGRDDGLGIALTAQAEARGVIDHVRILGARDDVPDLLAAADILALASHEEGSPNAVIEAMAAGLAVVVTDAGGSAEAVGEAGIVVPRQDPQALAEALVRLGTDSALRAALGAAAKARALAQFSLDACVERYVALYSGLAAGRSPAELLPVGA